MMSLIDCLAALTWNTELKIASQIHQNCGVASLMKGSNAGRFLHIGKIITLNREIQNIGPRWMKVSRDSWSAGFKVLQGSITFPSRKENK